MTYLSTNFWRESHSRKFSHFNATECNKTSHFLAQLFQKSKGDFVRTNPMKMCSSKCKIKKKNLLVIPTIKQLARCAPLISCLFTLLAPRSQINPGKAKTNSHLASRKATRTLVAKLPREFLGQTAYKYNFLSVHTFIRLEYTKQQTWQIDFQY